MNTINFYLISHDLGDHNDHKIDDHMTSNNIFENFSHVYVFIGFEVKELIYDHRLLSSVDMTTWRS